MQGSIAFAGLVFLIAGCSEDKPVDPKRAKFAEVGLGNAYDACKNVDDIKKSGPTYDRSEFNGVNTCLRSIVNSDSDSPSFKRRCELVPNSRVVPLNTTNASARKKTVCDIALYL